MLSGVRVGGGSLSRYFLLLFALLLSGGTASGQTASTSASSDAQTAVAADGPTGKTSTKDKIKRWFEFDQLSAATRYHFIEKRQ